MQKNTEAVPQVLREGILSWYPFDGTERVLLIGGDCDALAGLLRRRCGSLILAGEDEAAAGDLPGGPFDRIFLYDPQLSGDGLQALFAAAREHLAPDGTLLVGCRNRYGLRYFCGGLDDEVQTPFENLDSVERTAAEPEACCGRLHSRAEAERIAARAGFAPGYYYYPLPDQWFPQLILTDAYRPEGSIRDRLITPDFFDSPLVADTSRLYDALIRDGLLADLANFYLAEYRPAGSPEPERRVVYAVLTADRGLENGLATVLYSDETAEKTALWPEGRETIRRIYENGEYLKERGLAVVPQTLSEDRIEMPLIREMPLLEHIRACITEGPDAVRRVFSELWQEILRSSEPSSLTDEEALAAWGVPAAELGPVLGRGMTDLIPYNAFFTKNGFLFYDQEFSIQNCPARYILYRAVHYSRIHLPALEGVLPERELLASFGLTDRGIRAFETRENAFVAENRRIKENALLWRNAADARHVGARRRRLLAEGPDPDVLALLRRVHAVQLDLLHRFDRLCGELGLRYYAIHGTLLGAVRGGGFIPWDDDVDLAMPRADYDRLIAAADRLEAPYVLQSPENAKNCYYGGYAKLRNDGTAAIESQHLWRSCCQGIWIDILPLDAVPADAAARKKLEKKISRRQRLMMIKTYPLSAGMLDGLGSTRTAALYLARRLFQRDRVWRGLKRLFTKTRDGEKLSILACYYREQPNRNLYEKEDFCGETRLPFEDMELPVPAGFDRILRSRYGGSYLLPPENTRRRHRLNIWFDPDRSWRETDRAEIRERLIAANDRALLGKENEG